nr:hypothetical protein [Nocardia sp. NRRL WC-3656]
MVRKMVRRPDFHGVLGEAFVGAAQQGQIDRGGDAVGPVATQHHSQELFVQLVHGVVVGVQTSGGVRVAGIEDGGGVGGDMPGEHRHAVQVPRGERAC